MGPRCPSPAGPESIANDDRSSAQDLSIKHYLTKSFAPSGRSVLPAALSSFTTRRICESSRTRWMQWTRQRQARNGVAEAERLWAIDRHGQNSFVATTLWKLQITRGPASVPAGNGVDGKSYGLAPRMWRQSCSAFRRVVKRSPSARRRWQTSQSPGEPEVSRNSIAQGKAGSIRLNLWSTRYFLCARP